MPLRPLTILIGPNDSGKSAFLAAIQYLCEALPPDTLDAWRSMATDGIEVDSRVNGTSMTRKGGAGTVWNNQREHVLPITIYQLPNHGVPMISGGYSDTGEPPELRPNGDGIPTLLDHLLRRDRTRFFQYLDVVRTLIPGLEDIEISTPDPSQRRLDLLIEKGFRMPASRASVGVRLILFFSALAWHPKPPRTVLIEEPENGVHPKRLRDVIQLLREITQGKHGAHAAQVILTTHSPHLLDYVDLAQDQVLVFQRNDDGSRSAEPADAERLKTFLDEFMLGEVWYNQGEAGLVSPSA